MTWLPISLKNAAKCDKWYQLQNLSITESLNANGAWKKTLVFNSKHAMFSVSNKNQKIKKQILCLALWGQKNESFLPCVPARWLKLCAFTIVGAIVSEISFFSCTHLCVRGELLWASFARKPKTTKTIESDFSCVWNFFSQAWSTKKQYFLVH